MPSTINFSFGDLILVPFPYTDHSAMKKRPAVVVSSSELHRESIDIVILAVTTQPRAASSLEVSISAWKSAGLLRPSVIKPVFATIERSMILKRLGALDPADLDALTDALPKMLG